MNTFTNFEDLRNEVLAQLSRSPKANLDEYKSILKELYKQKKKIRAKELQKMLGIKMSLETLNRRLSVLRKKKIIKVI